MELNSLEKIIDNLIKLMIVLLRNKTKKGLKKNYI